MKTYILGMLFFVITMPGLRAQSTNQSDEVKAIRAVMAAQQQDWNNSNLEGFMDGYWKSDSLKFYSSRGVTYGWDNTLKNYKKGYPSKAHTGTLKFKINDISKINEGAYFLMGEYHLTREIGDANGVFLIIFKKINGEWKIIADMSS